MTTNPKTSSFRTSPEFILDILNIRQLEPHEIGQLADLNQEVFNHVQVISRENPEDLVILAAYYYDTLLAFKVGFAQNKTDFYSAKGCVLPEFRRMGIATKLLWRMILTVQRMGYQTFLYDTFPEIHPGMYELGIQEGFEVRDRIWNEEKKAEQIKMGMKISTQIKR